MTLETGASLGRYQLKVYDHVKIYRRSTKLPNKLKSVTHLNVQRRWSIKEYDPVNCTTHENWTILTGVRGCFQTLYLYGKMGVGSLK